MNVILPVQTRDGIDDVEQFFFLRIMIMRVAESLFVRAASGEVTLSIENWNCHVVTEAYARAFPDFHLSRRSGSFGFPAEFPGDSGFTWQQHSWLVPECASGWVLDVAPCNGVLTPLLVCISKPPWKGLFLEDLRMPRSVLDENDNARAQVLANVLTDILQQYHS